MIWGATDGVENVVNVTPETQLIAITCVATPEPQLLRWSDVYIRPAPTQSDSEKLSIDVAACSANLSTLPEYVWQFGVFVPRTHPLYR